jgi:hypothetical protein
VLVSPPVSLPFPPEGYSLPPAPVQTPYRPTTAPAQAQAPRTTPTVRSQIPDDPSPARTLQPAARPREVVTIPTPEQLGVVSGKSAEAGIDWATVNRRLDSLGATCFQLQRLPQGRWRVICLLPTTQPEHSQRIQAEAEAKAEAVRLTLEQAEQWSQKR